MQIFRNNKKTIRILLLVILLLTMLITTASISLAKSSINNNSLKPVVPGSGQWTNEGFEPVDNFEGIVSIDTETDKYKNEDVAKVIDNIKSGEGVSIKNIIETTKQPENKTDASSFPTTEDYDVNIEMYDRITDFYELQYRKDGVDTSVKAGEVMIVIPETQGMRGGDLVVLIIDSKDGEMYLVPPKTFNSSIGAMTVDIPCAGPYCVMHKMPIVVRNADPENYPNKELSEIIKNLPYNKVIECKDFLEETGIGNFEELEIAEGIYIDPKKYSSAIALSDVAVELGRDEFSYDLSARFRANLYRGNDKVDWERILNYAGVDYDKSEIKKDDRNLTKIAPIKLKDCFVYHIDAATQEVSIIYEPEVCWSTFGELNKLNEERIEKEDILYWDVNDIDRQNEKDRKLNVDEEKRGFLSRLFDKAYAAETVDETFNNDEDVCIVINGDEYLGMGPFLLFMPKPHKFPWWILIVIAVLFLIWYYLRRDEKDEDEEERKDENAGITESFGDKMGNINS